MTEPAPDNGTVKTLRVQLNSGPPWDMPAEMMVTVIQSMAADSPAFVGKHIQAALLGEMPASRGRPRGIGAS